MALAFITGTAVGTVLWALLAAFGAARLAAGAPMMIAGLQLLVGVALIVIGGRLILGALGPPGLEGRRAEAVPPAAFAQGLLLTLASSNEVIFWSAILAVAVLEGEPSPFFGITLVGGVVVIGVVFEGALFWLASAGVVGRLIRRLRQPLEIALGIAFCTTGGVLIGVN